MKCTGFLFNCPVDGDPPPPQPTTPATPPPPPPVEPNE